MTDIPRPFLQALRVATRRRAIPDRVQGAMRRHLEQLQAVILDDNVLGAGVSEKVTDGQLTGELALTFYVRSKRPRVTLDRAVTVPRVISSPNGRALFTDVFEVGDVLPQAAIASTPIRPGFSVSHASLAAGTLGAVVRTPRGPAILSNAHVLAPIGTARFGDPIVYPGASDGGVVPQNVIATLSGYRALRFGPGFPNAFDAAIADVVDPREVELAPSIPGVRTPLRVAAPKKDMQVTLVGRTSLQRQTTIRDPVANIQVPYGRSGWAGFFGQCRCDPVTDHGDSGAVVVDRATGAIVGLHFAASAEATFFSPIEPIMRSLGFTF